MQAGGAPVVAGVWEVFLAIATKPPALQVAAVENFAGVVSEVMGMADLMARRRIALAASRLPAGGGPPTPPAPPPVPTPTPPPPPADFIPRHVPSVVFKEAVADIVERYPTTVPANVRSLGTEAVQEWMGTLYEEQGFAVARTTQQVVTRRVQTVVAQGIEKGTDARTVIKQIVDAAGEHGDEWSRGYAETVWRANMQTAYSNGIHEQVRSPGAAAVIGALTFDAVGGRTGDGDTTEICKAAHGTTAPPDHDIWNYRTPGLHFG